MYETGLCEAGPYTPTTMASGQDILVSRSCGLLRAGPLQLTVNAVRNTRLLPQKEFMLTEADEKLASGAEESTVRTRDCARACGARGQDGSEYS